MRSLKKISLVFMSMYLSSILFSTSIIVEDNIQYPILNSLASKYSIDKNTCNVVFPNLENEMNVEISRNKGEIVATAMGYFVGDAIITGLGTHFLVSLAHKTKIFNKLDDILDLKKVRKGEEELSKSFITARKYAFLGSTLGIPSAHLVYNVIDKERILSEYVNPKDIYNFEMRTFKSLLQYVYVINNCYKVKDIEKMKRIIENLVKLDKLVEESKQSNIIVSKMKGMILFSNENNLKEFLTLYRETLMLINDITLSEKHLVKIDRNKINEIKTKIITGDFDISLLEKLNKEELKVLLQDKEVFKKLSEEYPTLSKELQKKLSSLVEDVGITLGPSVSSYLSNIINTVKLFDNYVPLKDILSYLEIQYENPFLTEYDVEEIFEYVKNELYNKLYSYYQNIIPPNDVFWEHIEEIKKVKNPTELIKVSELIKKDIDRINAINNFDTFYNEQVKFLDAVNEAINKYNIDLLDESSTIIRVLNELKKYDVRKDAKKVQELLTELERAKDKARYKFQQEVKNQQEIFFSIEKEKPIIKEYSIKNGKIIQGNVLRVIKVKIPDEKLKPLYDGLEITLDSIKKDGRGLYNLRVRYDSDLFALITKDEPDEYTVVAKFNSDSSSNENKVYIEYTQDVGILNKNYVVKELGSKNKGSLISVKIDIKTFNNESFSGLLPVKLDLTNNKIIKNEDVLVSNNIVYINLDNTNEKSFSLKNYDLYYVLKEGKEKDMFTEEKGKFKIKTRIYNIINNNPTVFENVPLNINNIDDDVIEIYIIDNNGNIINHIDSEKLASGNLIVKVPLIDNGENPVYVKEIIQDKQIQMQRALQHYRDKMETINNYIEKVKKISNENTPDDIRNLLSRVNVEIENLEDAVKNNDYIEYTKIINNLNYDYEKLESKVLKWMEEKLGKEKTTRIILDEIKEKVRKMENLLYNSRSAFTDTEYSKYLNKLTNIKNKINLIESSLEYRDLENAYENAIQIKPEVNTLLDILTTKVTAKKTIKINALEVKINNLQYKLKQLSDLGDDQATVFLNQINTYKATLEDLKNEKKISLESLFENINEINSEIEKINTQIEFYYGEKVKDLETDVFEEYRKVKNTYYLLKQKIKLFKLLGVPINEYKPLEEKLWNIENNLNDIKKFLDKISNVKTSLDKYILLLNAKEKLDQINIDYESNLDILVQNLIKRMKDELDKLRMELVSIKISAEKNKDLKTMKESMELLKEINEIEAKLNSNSLSTTEIQQTKEEIEKIKTNIENLKAGITVSGSSNLISKIFYTIFGLFSILIIVISLGRDKIKEYIRNLKKKSTDKNEEVNVTEDNHDGNRETNKVENNYNKNEENKPGNNRGDSMNKEKLRKLKELEKLRKIEKP